MDLKSYEFEKTGMCMATDKKLLEEAKKRGFYNGNTEHNKLFSQLFFSGGKVNFKKDIDENFQKKAWPYLRAFMGSFEPKHEEKEAISAMLLSEMVDA
jgi:hypothetical protein